MKDPEQRADCGRRPRQRQGGGNGGAVYGLGLIGALVWFWRQAETPEEQLVAIGKAVVWPAFLVYAAFQKLAE